MQKSTLNHHKEPPPNHRGTKPGPPTSTTDNSIRGKGSGVSTKGLIFKELPSPSPRALPNSATKHHNETTLYTAQSLPRESKAGDHYHSGDGTVPENKRRITIGEDDAWPGAEKKWIDIYSNRT
ncbi:hypothetical protein Rs2_45162 [Raphanus sativus]|nr:hypothetical protein Rs2_45162 [Raphanus sativus]